MFKASRQPPACYADMIVLLTFFKSKSCGFHCCHSAKNLQLRSSAFVVGSTSLTLFSTSAAFFLSVLLLLPLLHWEMECPSVLLLSVCWKRLQLANVFFPTHSWAIALKHWAVFSVHGIQQEWHFLPSASYSHSLTIGCWQPLVQFALSLTLLWKHIPRIFQGRQV